MSVIIFALIVGGFYLCSKNKDYGKGLWMLLLCFLALPVGAQNEKGNSETAKSVEMKEVTVEAARVTKKLDGMLIVPSDAQREAATDGYSLLGKLSLPRIRVDEVMRTMCL